MSGTLAGLTVLLTRTGTLAEELRALGATVREAPVTRWEPIPVEVDGVDFDWAGFDWIVFTSARAVAHWKAPFPESGLRIACVGPATADAVRERGREPDFVPAEHNAEALAAGLVERWSMDGSRVVFPCSDLARPTIEERLGAAGAEVTRVECYRTAPVDSLPAGVADGADVVVFLSPSAVDAWVGLGGDLRAAVALAIGPTTATAIAEHGAVPVTARRADRDGLIEALREIER